MANNSQYNKFGSLKQVREALYSLFHAASSSRGEICPHFQTLLLKVIENGRGLPLNEEKVQVLLSELDKDASTCSICSSQLEYFFKQNPSSQNNYSSNNHIFQQYIPNKEIEPPETSPTQAQPLNQKFPLNTPLLLTNYSHNYIPRPLSNPTQFYRGMPVFTTPLQELAKSTTKYITDYPHWTSTNFNGDMDIESHSNVIKPDHLHVSYNQSNSYNTTCAMMSLLKRDCIVEHPTFRRTLPCGHTFHLECLLTFQSIALRDIDYQPGVIVCPVCRNIESRPVNKRSLSEGDVNNRSSYQVDDSIKKQKLEQQLQNSGKQTNNINRNSKKRSNDYLDITSKRAKIASEY